MRPWAIVAGFLALCALVVWGVTSEEPWLKGLAVMAFLGAIVAAAAVSRDMREDLGAKFGPLTWVARGGFRFSGRRIAITIAAVVAAVYAAERVERLGHPDAGLADVVERLTPRASERAPILAAELIERELPAEDQRYTPYGVFLRYERDVVALLPRTVGTTVERLPAERAYVKYGAVLGRFWGPAYHATPEVRESALAVPDLRDQRAAARALAAAERAHGACYGWDVEVRSGDRQGRLWGSGAGIGTRVSPDCERSVVLSGWIDPRAGRFRRRGEPGEWSLWVDHRLEDDFPQVSWEAISVPFVELIQGATTEPSDGGAIAGKGLLEFIGALPLLAQEADALRAVPLPPPQRPAGALSEVERSDAARAAEETFAATVAALLRVGAAFAGITFLFALLAGLVAAAIRRLRPPPAAPEAPPGAPGRTRRHGRRRTRRGAGRR